MAMTRHSLFSVQTLGIPSVTYLELDDISQFEAEKIYNIGILEGRDLRYEKTCSGVTECEKFATELKRVHGRDSKIFFYEKMLAEVVCSFRIVRKDDYTLIEPNKIDDITRSKIVEWFKLLQKNYDFTNPIVGSISKDSEGRLFVSSIQ